MGKNQILTNTQRTIFDQVKLHPYLSQKFFFTGGTALSVCYLKHRISDDLDFFTLSDFDRGEITEILRSWAKQYQFTFRTSLHGFALFAYINFPGQPPLKVDFGRYPYPKLAPETKYHGFPVDSLLDIAVNKIASISQRHSVKDYVDLYYLLRRFTSWDLIEGMRIKFRTELEPFLLAAELLRADSFTTLPKMIKPLNLNQLQKFFHSEAKKLALKVVV